MPSAELKQIYARRWGIETSFRDPKYAVGIHPHAFRHTAASTMIANGVDLVTAANELGHSNATTTATIYAHQIATAKAKAGEVRSAVFNRKRERKDSDGVTLDGCQAIDI